jgi:peptidoglycan L-alanyl-D-glutamate endopeptidase CwlK
VSFILDEKSLERLSQCDSRLQQIAHKLIQEFDFVVLCGHRNKEDQEKAEREGHSREHWPHSKHNTLPSIAMDIAPEHPIDWNNLHRFNDMLDRVERIAKELGIVVRLGRNMPHLKDYPHVEIKIS